MGKLDIVPFRSSYFNVAIGDFQPPPPPKQPSPEAKRTISYVANPKPYQDVMSNLLDAIRTGNHQAAQKHFTPEGYEMYRSILQYGQARIIREPEFNFVHFENGVMCRALPMSFHYKNNNRTFVEDMVFHFNGDKKIASLSFGLGQDALADIIYNDAWDERVRMIIINFLENYKTAYALKCADYIESLFADDALIIVGSILKTKTTGDNPYSNNQIVVYNRYDKQEFIRRLRHSFASNEFINIHFEDNIIRRSGRGGDIYGIQIKQNYSSTNYGDTGYLFLLVDLNEPDQPVIHVRTWQPHKNPDGSIYGLGDF